MTIHWKAVEQFWTSHLSGVKGLMISVPVKRGVLSQRLDNDSFLTKEIYYYYYNYYYYYYYYICSEGAIAVKQCSIHYKCRAALRKWKNEDAKIPVTPSFVLGTHQTVFLSDKCLARNSE